ncbi:MAG: hypothetical protein ABIR28_00465 [Vicinamibacteria bacterium]
MRKGTKLLALVIIAPLMMALVAFIGGTVVQQLWNWLLPSLFGWREVTFWQALGLLALCRILFGGFGFRPYRGSRMRRHMMERWSGMSPEEREKFREGMRHRWGHGQERASADSPSPEN